MNDLAANPTLLRRSPASTIQRRFGSDKKKARGQAVTGASGKQEQANGLSPADKATQQAAMARGANAQMNLQADIAPLESALRKLAANPGPRTAAEAAAAAAVSDKAQRILDVVPGPTTKKTEQLLGEQFPAERKRLRHLIDDAQIICDEFSVVQTKQRAGEIYMDAGKAAQTDGGFKKLTATSKAVGFSDLGLDPAKADKEKRTKLIRDAGADLGLSPAETAAILTFTAEDYRYINPATANNDAWMKGANYSLIDKPNLSPEEAKQLKASFKEVKIGNARERMSERKQDLADRKQEGSLHAGMAMEGFAKMPVWKGTAYRGEVLKQADFDKKFELVNPGLLSRRKTKKYKAREKTITRTAISSSSKAENIARAFWTIAGGSVPDPKVQVLWQLELTNGRDIEPISNSPHEKEVAMLPGSEMVVTETTWVEGPAAYSPKYLLVKCVQRK